MQIGKVILALVVQVAETWDRENGAILDVDAVGLVGLDGWGRVSVKMYLGNSKGTYLVGAER